MTRKQEKNIETLISALLAFSTVALMVSGGMSQGEGAITIALLLVARAINRLEVK